MAIIFYAITKTRLMDISIVITRNAALVIVGTGYIIGLFFTAILIKWLGVTNDYVFLSLLSIYLIFTGLSFEKVRLNLQTTTNKRFIKGWYDLDVVVIHLKNRLVHVTTRQEAATAAKEILFDEVEINALDVLIRTEINGEEEKDAKKFQYALMGRPKNALPEDHPLIKYFTNWPAYIPAADLPNEVKSSVKESDWLNTLRLEVNGQVYQDKVSYYVPCYCYYSSSLPEMIFLLSGKASGNAFDLNDYKLLDALETQMGVVLNRIKPLEKAKADLGTEQELVKKQSEVLERTARLSIIGELAANIAHEIKNPIGSVRMLAELLENKYAKIEQARAGCPDEAKQFIEDTAKYARNMITAIDRVLTISNELMKLSSRTTVLTLAPTDVNKAVEESFDMYYGEGINIIKDLKPVPEIRADKSKLIQVFINISQNAVNAMNKRGTLTVRTYFDERNKLVVVEFSDTGPGISPEDMGKIFTPYFTKSKEGTGLGLSNCHRIIEEHNGEIKVRSAPHQGATFIISLPLDPETAI